MERRTTWMMRPADAWLDRAGIAMSFLCLVHCLALPVLIALLPALASVLAVPEQFHLVMVCFAAPTSAIALWTGRARHRASWPVVLGGCGIALLFVGAVLVEGWSEVALTVAGSLALAGAHLVNWSKRAACGHHA